jgi:hypothetical protein
LHHQVSTDDASRCHASGTKNYSLITSDRILDKFSSARQLPLGNTYEAIICYCPTGPPKPLYTTPDFGRFRTKVPPQHNGQQGVVETCPSGCHAEARCLVCNSLLRFMSACLHATLCSRVGGEVMWGCLSTDLSTSITPTDWDFLT